MHQQHLFGTLLTAFRQRKPGLSQTRLAELVGYAPAILVRMGQGKKDLTGPSGRERILRIVATLCDEGIRLTVDEVNALLTSANLPPLYDGLPIEAALRRRLQAGGESVPITPRNNLPIQRNVFIGRDNEIASLCERLTSARLITITGAGGMGKTRLALESARRLAHVWPDGVRWVELGPLTSSTQAVQAVAQAIGLSTAGSELNPAAIWRFLETKRTLLILDNSEHLIEACAELANSLLDHCPAVHILATSREALRIPGEMIWELSTLTTPTAVTLKPEALFAHDAVQFFVDRVTLVRRDFVLGTHNARSVAEICQSMDGIPLALELAAGLTLGMSVQELATHLPHYLPLLTDGYRNPQHHRTMRNALAWSFEWLSAEQKRLLLNLSVFVGGFTASAAAAIHQNTLDEVIPLLLALVRKSLVLAATQDGETRYRLLEPIRQYTLEKVVSAGQLPGLRDHHLAYFASFAEQVDVGMMGSECGVWATRVQTDYNNLRAAREWSRTDDARQGRQGLELRLVGALWRYWLQVAQLREGCAWVQAALDREHAHPSLQPNRAAHARALYGLAWQHRYLRNYVAMSRLAEQGLALCQELGDAHGTAMCVLLLSVQAQIAFDYSLADALRSQSLHTLKKLGDEFMEINVLLEDSWTSLDKGDYTHTERQLKQYVSISREAKDLNNLWTTLWWLAFTAVRRGECGAAIEWLQQSRVAAHESGISNFMARTIELWAVCEPQQALTLGEEELARYRHAGDDVGIADMQLALGRIQMDLGQLDAAQVLLMDCLKLWRRLGMAGNEWGGAGWACLELGHLAAMQGDSPLAVAEQWFKHGLAHFRDVGMKWGIALVLAGLHDMALHLGQTDRAARCAGAASGMLRPEELITLRPADRLPFERAIASAQVRCARDTAFAVARHAGQGIPLIQVCQWVLEVENT